MKLKWTQLSFFSAFFPAIFTAMVLIATSAAHAGETIVAVAANFTEPAKAIAEKFEQHTGHKAVLSFGATGNFYNQIKNGAPFEIFLAADIERPKKLVEEGYALKTSEFTYAIGALVLWSAKPNLVTGPDVLSRADITHIAFCNPDAAPYGKAAVETMAALNLTDRIKPKLVEGQNIAQAFQFVKTGNAEIGFVALSQVIHEKGGSQWLVPQQYYQPIKQDGVLLKRGESNEVATAFMAFLKSDDAQSIIKTYGYKIAE